MKSRENCFLLLAVNAELQKEGERAAVYYEQLLLYAPEFAEGYGKYGLFLFAKRSEEFQQETLCFIQKQ